ncbi:MAG: metal-sensitive transcriptional regulator [Actinomycetota bacterium]
MGGYAISNDDLKRRLRKIEGQTRGLQRMVDDGASCIDILTQLNSVTAALRAVGLGLLDDHVRRCVHGGLERGDDEQIEELLSAVARFAGR